MLSYGTENGLIKDFDMRTKNEVRSANLHQSSKVVAITSKGKYLISASQDSRVIIYDYMMQQEIRDLKLDKLVVSPISSLMLMENEKILVIRDARGLTPIDIETTKQAEISV